MSDKFTALDRRTFKNYIELMRELAREGFENEFDNSLVIRAIVARIDQVQKLAGRYTQVYLKTICELDQVYGKVLKVVMQSTECSTAQETVVLFENENALKVNSNVLTERYIEPDCVQQYIHLKKSAVLEHVDRLNANIPVGAPGYPKAIIAALFHELEVYLVDQECTANLQVNKDSITVQYYIGKNKYTEITVTPLYSEHTVVNLIS